MKANYLMKQCPQCPFRMLFSISCELVDGSRSVVRFRHRLRGKGISYMVLPSFIQTPAATVRSRPLGSVVSCVRSHFSAVQADTQHVSFSYCYWFLVPLVLGSP